MKNFPKINLVKDALHGMAYYIFLKSLRSLEEFRKNPHVKIPPKSPSANFQSLATIKNQFLIRKRIFLHFRPRTAQRTVAPSGLSARPLSSAHPNLRRLFFKFAQPGGYAFPSVTATRAPLVSSVVSPAPPTPVRISPRRCLAPWMPPSFYSSPSSLLPLNPLQTEHSRPLTPSMALMQLTPALTALATPPCCSPGPYKRRAPSPEFTAPLPAHMPLSPS
jgi:hypothetical protein